MAKYNVKQFTNYDIINNNIRNGYYSVISDTEDVDIVKIGYICGLENINKPFYISYKSDITEHTSGYPIYPSKSGMYEFQVEEITKEGALYNAIPKVKKIWVPADIKFKLDYVIMTQE